MHAAVWRDFDACCDELAPSLSSSYYAIYRLFFRLPLAVSRHGNIRALQVDRRRGSFGDQREWDEKLLRWVAVGCRCVFFCLFVLVVLLNFVFVLLIFVGSFGLSGGLCSDSFDLSQVFIYRWWMDDKR